MHDYYGLPWDGTYYICSHCPGTIARCDACGDPATQWTQDSANEHVVYLACDSEGCKEAMLNSAYQSKKMPPPPITQKSFPAAPRVDVFEMCHEAYYGTPCRCQGPHRLRGSR